MASALLVRPARRRLSPRWSVLLEPWWAAAVVPVLLVAHSALLIGTVVAVSVMPMALSTWTILVAMVATHSGGLRQHCGEAPA